MAAPLGIAGLRFAASLVVWGGRKGAVLAGLDDCDRELVWKWNLLVVKRRAVEEQRVPAPPERRRELIHDADLDTGRALLRTLAGKRRLLGVQIRTQSDSHCNQQRSGRADARGRGHLRRDIHGLRLCAQLLPYRAHIGKTTFDTTLDRPIVGAMPGYLRVLVHGRRQHNTAQVIHVLPDEVHSAWPPPAPPTLRLARFHAAPRLCPRRARRG